jgi:hypothetical protein
VSINAKKYSPKHIEIAKAEKKVLFMWEMDKRFVEDENDRAVIQCCGTMSVERARRIWAIIQEVDS